MNYQLLQLNCAHNGYQIIERSIQRLHGIAIFDSRGNLIMSKVLNAHSGTTGQIREVIAESFMQELFH